MKRDLIWDYKRLYYLVILDRSKLELYDTVPFPHLTVEGLLLFHMLLIIFNIRTNEQVYKRIIPCTLLTKMWCSCRKARLHKATLSLATFFYCFQWHFLGLPPHTINLEGRENFPKESNYNIDQFCLYSLKLGLPSRSDFPSLVLQRQGSCDKICFLPFFVSATLQYQCVPNVCDVILLWM